MYRFLQIFFFICLALPIFGSANDFKQVDSLKTIVATHQNDTAVIDALNKLSKELRWSDQVAALDYAIKAEKASEEIDFVKGLALAYHNIGAIYANKRNNELALEYYNKCLTLHTELGDKEGIADTYGNIGLIYRRLREFKNALSYHNKSLELKKQLNDSIGIAYSYGNIGVIFTEQGKYDKALIHFYKSLRIKESLGDTYGIANSYGNIGIIYLKINSLDQAKVSLERALNLFNELDNKTGVAISSLHLGEIYFKQSNHQKAIRAYRESLDIYTELGIIKGMADAYNRLGEIYYSLGNDSLAREDFVKSLDYFKKIENIEGIIATRISLAMLFKKYYNYDDAIRQLRMAIKLANRDGFNAQERKALNLLADILLKKNEHIEAAELLIRAREISDSLFGEKLIEEVTQITMQHNFDNQLKEKAFKQKSDKLLQEIKMKRLRYSRNILIIGIFVLLVIGAIVYTNSRIINGKNKLLEKQKERIGNQMNMLNRQKRELEMANKTKDKFLSIIGHDLRNPFNAINTFVALVNEQSDELDQKIINRYLQVIKEAGSNAQNLLENLLEWAMAQSGELVPEINPVSVNSILKGNVMLVSETAYQKGVNLNLELDSDVLVDIDKNMINTVIRNLLSNAIKFTYEQGTVFIKTQVGKDEVKVIIEDTGIGIKKNQLDSIISDQQSHEDENISSGQNTGLGLILCKEFLFKHKTKLNVSSAVDKGTVFWFYLPINQGQSNL